MDETMLLSAENLCAGYRNREILHSVSLSFPKGKITVIAGRNGCGKSTLLKSLIRLIPIKSGRVLAGGENTAKFSARDMARRVAYLPQNKPIPELTVKTMVMHGRFAHLDFPRRYRAQDRQAAQKAMELTELTEYEDCLLSQLSGGTQQRAFLAMALAQEAPVILMDEPTSFMDPAHRQKFMALCRNLADQGMAVGMVLHDLTAAMKYADRLVLMEEGKIVCAGKPEEVYETGVLTQVFGIEIHRTQVPEGTLYY